MYHSSMGILAALAMYVLFFAVVIIVCYVVSSLAYMKALKALGYDKPWMAWIPFANYYALADASLNGAESITLFGSLTLPAVAFKLWWIAAIVCVFIPVIGNLLNLVLRVICLGTCFIKIYSRLDNQTEQEVQVIGYVSGLFAIVAWVKFLAGKYTA